MRERSVSQRRRRFVRPCAQPQCPDHGRRRTGGSDVHPHRHRQVERRRPVGLACRRAMTAFRRPDRNRRHIGFRQHPGCWSVPIAACSRSSARRFRVRQRTEQTVLEPASLTACAAIRRSTRSCTIGWRPGDEAFLPNAAACLRVLDAVLGLAAAKISAKWLVLETSRAPLHERAIFVGCRARRSRAGAPVRTMRRPQALLAAMSALYRSRQGTPLFRCGLQSSAAKSLRNSGGVRAGLAGRDRSPWRPGCR